MCLTFMIKNKKIMYIHPNTLEKRESQCVIPIGMIGVSNRIVKNGFDYICIDIPVEEYINPDYDIISDIEEFEPDIILIDLHWAIYSYSAIELCDKIKKYNPSIITILGGITATIYSNEIMKKHSNVDFIVTGDSEEPIITLLNEIENGTREYEKISNLVYRQGGQIKQNERSYLCNTLEKENYSNYDFLRNYEMFFEKQGYHKGIEFSSKLAWIPIARGCTYNCSYCGGNCKMFKKNFMRSGIVLNSIENIINSMNNLNKKYGIDTFGITHGLEIIDEDFAYSLLDEIEKLDFKPGIFNYLFQLPKIELLKRFVEVVDEKKSVIGLPISAGNEEIRKKNGKLFSDKEIYEALDFLNNKKIKIEIYFISNLKYDNEQNTIDTKKMIQEIYDKYGKTMNLEISYGLETVQPDSDKHEDSVLDSFEKFYYRYSPQFNEDLSKGKNIDYIDGVQKNNTALVKKLKEVNAIIEEKINPKIDVLYLFPPSNKQREFELSIGVAYIQAYIKQYGFLSEQLIPNNNNLPKIVDEIIALNPRVLGVSVYDTNYYYARLIAEEIKKRNEKIIIVFGGPTATFSSNLIMEKDKFVDFCIKGYGEKSTKKLLEYITSDNGNLKDIEGLVYRENGNIKGNDVIKIEKELDVYPSPYLSDISFWPERKIVFTSRGCVHNCVYCNCASMCQKNVSFHSVDRVISELKYISDNKNGEYVLIGDDAFTMNIERAKLICRRIIEEKIDLKLFCETRVDRIDDELISLMKEAGFIKVDFGLESAVPKILRNTKKIFYKEEDLDFSAEQNFLELMKSNIQKFKDVGIDVMVNIITGLPGETIEDAEKTIDFVQQLNIDSYSHNYLRIYSGTEIYDNLEKWGYKKSEDAFRLPYIVEYPIDVNSVKSLSNCVNRNEIVRMKNLVKEMVNDPQKIYKLENIEKNAVELQKIDINQELFIEIYKFEETKEIAKIIVEKRIPTNNIYFILKQKKQWLVFHNLERNCYVRCIIIENEKIDLNIKYNEILLVENYSDDIKRKMDEMNVNALVNPKIIVKGYQGLKNEDYWTELIKEFYKETNVKDGENVIKEFLVLIKYDIDTLKIEEIKNLIKKRLIKVEDLKFIASFIKYYKMGEIN